MTKTVLRALTEIGFIVFLFYSNLLMGEFTHSRDGANKGLGWAVRDIFTLENLVIAFIAALVGYVVVEILRDRLWENRNSR